MKNLPQPYAEYILIQRLDVTKSTGGIVLPADVDTLRGGVWRGKVLASGPGAIDKQGERVPMQVEVGDEVLVDRHACVNNEILDEYGLNRESMYLVSQDYVLARGKNLAP